MNNSFINITGKLPQGLVELYTDIHTHAESLGISYLVVGATARDLVLVHGYGSKIERGTRDVDFAIDVPNWDSFIAIKKQLIAEGYIEDTKIIHRLIFNDSKGLPWEIDIVPFGEIEDEKSSISWPPKNDIVMNVLGFREAIENSLKIQINEEPEVIIPVVSPVAMSILKLVAWLDRDIQKRPKDATDFKYIIETYTKIPAIFDAVYEDGCMEAQDWVETKASAMKLGQDVSSIILPITQEFIQTKLFEKPEIMEAFARDMLGRGQASLDEVFELLEIFRDAFIKCCE